MKYFFIVVLVLIATFFGGGLIANKGSVSKTIEFALPTLRGIIQDNVAKVQKLPTPTPYVFSEDKLWSLVNSWETKQGYSPYIKNNRLCYFANVRLDEIKKDFSHNGFWKHKSDLTFQDIYGDLGENLANRYYSEQEMFNAWLNSPEHLANLKRYYKYSCIKCSGVYPDNYCVQIFGNITPVGNNVTANTNLVTSLTIDMARNCSNQAQELMSSWKRARGQVDDTKLNQLLDSYARQIVFCNQIINDMSGGNAASQDDINLWNGVSKMANETNALTNELNGH